MRKPLKLTLIVLIGVIALFLAINAYFILVESCRTKIPDSIVISPDGNEIVAPSSRVCTRGLSLVNWLGERGPCLIPGTCSSSAALLVWKANLKTGNVEILPTEDEQRFLCEQWPFSGARGRVHAIEFNRPEDTSDQVPFGFSRCDLFGKDVDGAIYRKQRIFGSTDFKRGLPGGWRYFYDIGHHIRTADGDAGIDIPLSDDTPAAQIGMPIVRR